MRRQQVQTTVRPSAYHSQLALLDEEPIRRLLGAILSRAVRDILAYADSPQDHLRKHAHEAWQWVHGEDSDQAITSFGGLCSSLSVNATATRRRISELAAGKLPWTP